METPLTANIRLDRTPPTLQEYERAGGYQGLRRALQKHAPAEIVQMVIAANLRGRGGAGFPTGKKWTFMPKVDEAARPRYFVVNGDEMEPGTFKDRRLLEGNPHQMVESAAVSSYAIQADVCYIFIRHEYHAAAARIEQAIAEAGATGYLGRNILGSGYSLEMHVHTSAGRYMCGDETGLLDALEGRRAAPRNKPPHPQVCGLWGRPTVVNNVETVCNVHHIINRGPDWFNALSLSPNNGGTKLFGISGNVRRPGLWELPMGTTLHEILDRAGGMLEGRTLRGLIPGGASTGFLTAEHLHARMDFDSLQPCGSRLGTGTIVVLDDRTCPVGFVHNLQTFFARESCGWCTPCREGLPWIMRILAALENGEGQPGDLEILDEYVEHLGPGRTFCALAPGAMEPLGSALKYFRNDFARHVDEKCCPWNKAAH